eukprot:366139-Chlamydomonas_euryale.AAC.1
MGPGRIQRGSKDKAPSARRDTLIKAPALLQGGREGHKCGVLRDVCAVRSEGVWKQSASAGGGKPRVLQTSTR